MQLWIDVGNTRLKWQLYSEGQFQTSGAVLHKQDMRDAVETMISDLAFVEKLGANSVSFIGLASVLNKSALLELSAEIKLRLGIDPVCPQVKGEFMGLRCAYKNPEKLGIDRWLSLLSVFNEHNRLSCVISCGSAFTVDVVQADGLHLGGFILPGFQMSIDALLGGTHSVRFDSAAVECSDDFGIDTATAVCHGVMFQMLSVILRLRSVLGLQFPDEQAFLVLTGGDAEKLALLMEREGIEDFAINQDLVIQGLRLALQSHCAS